ncbi:MAG: hypothetical protein KKD77_21130, partial [Gammaproteobacteria bacterium]|nr:hypothetical protein [Gammaproteobacteria bacterium]
MRKLIYILILFLSPLAGVLANLAPRPHPNMSLIDQRLPRQLLLVGDEYPIYWYNKADDNEWYWWSMRADAYMVTDANYVWPFAAGDAGDVLFIRQIENTAEVYLDWGLFDANWVVVDGNEFTFP